MPSLPPVFGLRVVVMGVAGSGKTTVGERLAAELGVEYVDADTLHTPGNVAKMSAGIPLTDADRGPWLDAVGRWLADHESAVATCSALKRRYRDVLRSFAADAWFLHCTGSPELISSRITRRSHHFMPAELLASQFEALEPPGPDERAFSADVSKPPATVVSDFLAAVRRDPGRGELP